MMCEQELNDFFAHIDELSQDSNSLDSFQLVQKYKNENLRLTQTLHKIRESTKGIIDILKDERRVKLQAQKDLEQANARLKLVQEKYDDLEKTSVNNEFSYKEKIYDVEERHRKLTESHRELAEEYFDVIQESTMFYNFEIKKSRNQMITRTSNFLAELLGSKFKKPQFLTKRSAISDTKSTASKRQRSSKTESKAPSTEVKKSKRRKVDIFEMQSISEVSSPASFYDEGTDMGEENDSTFTYNSFSIGNETSYTLLQNKQSRITASCTQTINKCNCYIDLEDSELVSIGVNTDECEILPSVPSLSSDDFTFDNDPVTSTGDDFETIATEVCNLEPLEDVVEKSPVKSVEAIETHRNKDTPPSLLPVKNMRDQGTDCEPVTMKSDKSTLTIRSLTHRGTMTPSVVKKSFGMQFPDITFDRIIQEMSFVMPTCLSPIDEVLRVTVETQTDIQNVNRELMNAPSGDATKSSEEQSFIVLGQTIFNLFLDRLKENNKSVNDDANTREKLWQFLQQQYLSRFDELTFDEYFNVSFVSESENCDASIKEAKKEREVSKEAKDLKAKTPVADSMETSETVESACEDSTGSKNIKAPDVDSYEELNVSCSESSLRDPKEAAAVVPIVKQLELSESCSGSSLGDEKSAEKDNLESMELFEELAVSSSESSIKTAEALSEDSPVKTPNKDPVDEHINEIEKIFESIKCLGSEPLDFVSPILDFNDFIWSEIFPPSEETAEEDSPDEDDKVLAGYEIEHEPLEIPTESLFNCPEEPPSTALVKMTPYEPIDIPLEKFVNFKRVTKEDSENILIFDRNLRQRLVTWQQFHQVHKKGHDKILCKMRKTINAYLNSEWTDENLQTCVDQLANRRERVLLEAIYETVEDRACEKEISLEFTPPAPPLPRYQQKLILLISRLKEASYPQLPHLLIADLELKLFKCESTVVSCDHLRNMAYYYTALLDLFFEGNSTMAFYFIVKCIYFFSVKAVSMIFVVIKAFPLALPKKSALIKKYNDAADWENLTGLEMSKIRLDYECMDSLDLCVMFLLTHMKLYQKRGCDQAIQKNELFNYLPKYYGFSLNFMTLERLMGILRKRIEDGELTNMNIALILLGRRLNTDTIIESLMSMLTRFLNNRNEDDRAGADQICLLIEVISSILKPFLTEKKCTFERLFPIILNLLAKTSSQQIQECCMKAILRLQRFFENHKEIYEILKHHHEKGGEFSQSLKYAILTFIHRKNEVYFKN